MLTTRLYFLQRLSALILAPLVLGHLALMIYAVRGGLTSAEILARTEGSFWWAAYYGLFVLAVSLHAAIGVRVILYEYCHIQGWRLAAISWAFGLFLLILGGRAVIAVVLP